ncbi:MAG: LysR family transcriptional regulator [Alphaproteobacteria bacterium]|nr:LysR family transcriptional regulator [Alphaproteobacteria bacterium]
MRLPPLNALRAFEAAVRLGGFAQAAKELHVSPGAISRHVKLLEAHFGTPFFERLAQGLRPTQAALALQPRISAAFETIASAAAEVPRGAHNLEVVASPTFANRLLIPNLLRFNEQRPEITVSISLMLSDPWDFDPGTHDCVVATFHAAEWPKGLKSARVRGEALTPLCAPAFRGGRIIAPEDLRDVTLLQISACGQDWPNWLALNELSGLIDPTGGATFETGELAIRAAVEGLGVVLMDRFLVQQEIQDGDLIDLFPDSLPLDNGYYFLCAEARWQDPEITAFRDWVINDLAEVPT